MKRSLRNPKKDFSKKCKCILHNDTDINGNGCYDISSSKRYKASVINDFKEKKIFPLRAKYLCTTCYERYRNVDKTIDMQTTQKEIATTSVTANVQETVPTVETPELAKENSIAYLLHNLVDKLENESVETLLKGNENLWANLIFLIGNKICNKEIYKDGLTISKKYKDVNFLIQQDVDRYIKERNRLLVLFLCGVTGLDMSNTSTEKKMSFINTVEMCYYLRNFQLVLPFSFLGNFIQSSISGSKVVSVMNGKTSPGGCYTTFKNWLSEKGAKPLTCIDGPVDLFFDNIGKYIVKNYRISILKTKSADIITTGIQIALTTEDQNIQKRIDLKPSRSADVKSSHKVMQLEIQRANEDFRKFRFCFVKELFDYVVIGDEYDRSIDNNIKVNYFDMFVLKKYGFYISNKLVILQYLKLMIIHLYILILRKCQ